ncbi:MAG TPA: methyltransferase domain-containing protein [Dehalococcoidia bacterium]
MDLTTFRRLRSPEGAALLTEACALAPTEATFLSHLTALRRRHPPELAAAALELALLRRRAAAKFSRAAAMYVTAEALEQASSEVVAQHRARRYGGFGRVADLGCGIGGDTVALAAAARVLAVDADPLRLAMAEANAEAYGVRDRVEFALADLRAWSPPGGLDALFFDPARRRQGRRVFRAAAYEPPLETVLGWLPAVPAAGVKAAPGIDPAEVPPGCEVEFIAVGWELREAALWFGPLRTAGRRATLLPGGHTMTDRPAGPVPVAEPQAYLFEPNPAVIRAGLVEALAEELGAAKLDPQIAYLTGGRPVASPFVRAYAVEEWLPFGLKRLNARLRALGVGQVVVKKRGSPLDPEDLRRRLRLDGPERRTLVLTHVRGRHAVLICRDLTPDPAGASAGPAP